MTTHEKQKNHFNFLVISAYITRDIEDVTGGICYRHFGLYNQMLEYIAHSYPIARLSWYSVQDHEVTGISWTGTKKAGIIATIIDEWKRSRVDGRTLFVLVSFPYSLPKVARAFDYFTALLFLKAAQQFRQVFFLVDDMDLPVEQLVSLAEVPPSRLSRTYFRITEFVTVRTANMVTTISPMWKAYLERIYKLDPDDVLVVPCGCMLELMDRATAVKRPSDVKRILYAGQATRMKDIERLTRCIKRLIAKGLSIELRVSGDSYMNLPEWVIVAPHNWPDMVSEELSQADICVIPYSPERFSFNTTIPAKLIDYMAAGKPVVSMNLTGVRQIIERYHCGLIARNWEDFESCIQWLYDNPNEGREMGKRGRQAVEASFDYQRIAEELVVKCLESL